MSESFKEEFSLVKIYAAGTSYILNEIAKTSSITSDLTFVFGRDLAVKILFLAIYFALFENNAAFAYEDHSMHTWSPSGSMASQRISELFQDISQEDISEYLHRRAKGTQKEGVYYWA